MKRESDLQGEPPCLRERERQLVRFRARSLRTRLCIWEVGKLMSRKEERNDCLRIQEGRTLSTGLLAPPRLRILLGLYQGRTVSWP